MAARVTQINLEELHLSDAAKARVTQLALEVLILPGASGCALPWTIPTPAAFPAVATIRPSYFDELQGDWGEFGQLFGDLKPEFATLQAAKVRVFILRYTGLSVADAATLDDHYESTRGGLSFTFTQPRTSEALTGVRYAERPEADHTKIWAQSRSIKLVLFP